MSRQVIGISSEKDYTGIADSHSALAFILLFLTHFRAAAVFVDVA
jgi:hypothetical protein